jgi:hypothetical protein
MNYAAAKQRFSQPAQSNWIPKPLNRTGNLEKWKREMKRICPNPHEGGIVFVNKSYFSHDEKETIYERIGYKALRILDDGEVIWQRGQVTRLDVQEYNLWS